MYEITSRMAADIYMKAFTDPIRWKHACVLVNLFDEGDLDDPATLESLRPSHDAESGTRQAHGQVVDDVPTLPYTQTPILPKELCKPGMTSKICLHEHEGVDPFVVVKGARHKRTKPGTGFDDKQYLRTTWYLRNEKWELVARDERLRRLRSLLLISGLIPGIRSLTLWFPCQRVLLLPWRLPPWLVVSVQGIGDCALDLASCFLHVLQLSVQLVCEPHAMAVGEDRVHLRELVGEHFQHHLERKVNSTSRVVDVLVEERISPCAKGLRNDGVVDVDDPLKSSTLVRQDLVVERMEPLHQCASMPKAPSPTCVGDGVTAMSGELELSLSPTNCPY